MKLIMQIEQRILLLNQEIEELRKKRNKLPFRSSEAQRISNDIIENLRALVELEWVLKD